MTSYVDVKPSLPTHVLLHAFEPSYLSECITESAHFVCCRYNSTVWKDRSIFIPECKVTVSPPYGAEHCTGAGIALDRVQKILRQQGEAQRTNPA